MKSVSALLIIMAATFFQVNASDTKLNFASVKEAKKTECEAGVFEFTPTLLISTAASQELDSEASAGQITLEKVEAGFELAFSENATGFVLFELDEGHAVLCEAFASYAFNDVLTLTAGKMANNCGDFSSEAIYDPLILDYAETNEPAVQLDASGDMLYGGFTVYNGIITDNFSAFVPSIGINFNDKADFELSARVEIDAYTTYADYSFVAGIFPTEKLAFRGELYVESEEKELNVGKVLGYYGEADIYPTDKWTVFGRYDHVINDIDAEKKSGTMLIQAGGGYNLIDPLRVALSFGLANSIEEEKNDWTPSLAAEIRFEL